MFRSSPHRRALGSIPRLATALLVLAVAWVAGRELQQRLEVFRLAERARLFAERAPEQVREVEALYALPLEDAAPTRRQVARQLATVIEELGLDRDAERFPDARRSVARLYAAVHHDAPAAQLFDQLWRAGARSEDLARMRALAHGRSLLRRLSAPRAEELGVGDDPETRARLAELRRLLEAAGGVDPPPVISAAGTAVDARIVDDPEARTLGELIKILDALPSPVPALAELGVDDRLLVGVLHLVRARSLRADARDRARRAWAEAVRALNEARQRRPSDPDVLTALCAAWLDLLAEDFAVADAEPGGRAPRFSQAEVSCQDGLRLDPTSVPLLLGRSKVDLLHARWRLGRALDPTPWITDSRRLAKRVLALEPGHPLAVADAREADALAAAASEAVASEAVASEAEASEVKEPPGPDG